MNILDKIVDAAKLRVRQQKKEVPLEQIISALNTAAVNTVSAPEFPFERALKGKDISFICEVKKASPSKGVIAENFSYLKIAEEYQMAGADALSVLTEPEFFMGSDKYLEEIKGKVSIPVLRKDFIVDEYQIYQSKLIGADAILLICAALTNEELNRFFKTADGLGLSCLVEVHDESEVKMALDAKARVIGVNNRNLKTFETDVSLSERLRKLIPDDIIFVSESGIKTPNDIERLRKIKTNAVLIGETLMRSDDKGAEIKKLRQGDD